VPAMSMANWDSRMLASGIAASSRMSPGSRSRASPATSLAFRRRGRDRALGGRGDGVAPGHFDRPERAHCQRMSPTRRAGPWAARASPAMGFHSRCHVASKESAFTLCMQTTFLLISTAFMSPSSSKDASTHWLYGKELPCLRTAHLKVCVSRS